MHDEVAEFKLLAAWLLEYDDAALAEAPAAGVLMEVRAMTSQYRSREMVSVNETAQGLHNAGLWDKRTLREFDAACPRR